MPGSIPPRAIAASSTALVSKTDDCDWFAPVAWAVYGKDAGLHLHLATGWPESSCYAFVARDAEKRRKVNAAFLRQLLHSSQGEPFLLAFMHGCEARWWLDIERNMRLAETALRFDKEIREISAGWSSSSSRGS